MHLIVFDCASLKVIAQSKIQNPFLDEIVMDVFECTQSYISLEKSSENDDYSVYVRYD